MPLLYYFRPMAQLVEQRFPKPQVGGSSPSWPAIFIIFACAIYATRAVRII